MSRRIALIVAALGLCLASPPAHALLGGDGEAKPLLCGGVVGAAGVCVDNALPSLPQLPHLP